LIYSNGITLPLVDVYAAPLEDLGIVVDFIPSNSLLESGLELLEVGAMVYVLAVHVQDHC
jgi:hypothetical protein